MRVIATRWSIFPELRNAGFIIDHYPAGIACLSGESPVVCKSGPAKITVLLTFFRRSPEHSQIEHLNLPPGRHASSVNRKLASRKKEKTGHMTIFIHTEMILAAPL